ncbi:MAG TPA: arabinofuranosidase catalytic domain-containing protein [Polyangiaceae bacterium]|nr:arabinofuranosidase catalytic domain-containing protein [Polyangiaceae bacterium]
MRSSYWYGISFGLILASLGIGCALTSSDAGTGAVPSAYNAAISECLGGPPPTTDANAANKGPCDIYALDGGPCVSAHSTVRALYASFAGPLYQVKKANGTVQDISPLAPGGFANSAAQDSFCGEDACTISIIYDQSGKGNHLTKAPPGGAKMTAGNEANAKALPVTFSGHKVYGVKIVPGIGYRNNSPCGTATGDEPETEYMVVDGTVFNGGCCFDYGNMETSSRDDGEGTMEAVYFGKCTIWGKGDGNDGPWIMGDLENGLWAGNSSPFGENKPITWKYVTGMVKGDVAGSNHWTIKYGNAQSGALQMPFSGPRPNPRYIPMRKQGAVGLGTGGDNSNAATGNFFEGVMTARYSSNAADDAVQANIVTAYSQSTP